METFNETASGGLVVGGTGTNWVKYHSTASGGVVIDGDANLHPTGVTARGQSDVWSNNRFYVRDLEVGDNVFFLQRNRITAAVVQEVVSYSADKFYVIKKAKTPHWLVGQSASFTVHESRVVPADEPESYDLVQESVY